MCKASALEKEEFIVHKEKIFLIRISFIFFTKVKYACDNPENNTE